MPRVTDKGYELEGGCRPALAEGRASLALIWDAFPHRKDEGQAMAVAIALLIFAGVVGSHVFLWWSCRRGGGSFRI